MRKILENTALHSIEKEYTAPLFRIIFKTITVDNGTEFSDVLGIETAQSGKKARTKTDYCHPYSSWERGSNENQNKLVRRHYPKGCNFDPVSASEIKRVQNWINNYPREMFGWYCSADLFQAHLDSILAS